MNSHCCRLDAFKNRIESHRNFAQCGWWWWLTSEKPIRSGKYTQRVVRVRNVNIRDNTLSPPHSEQEIRCWFWNSKERASRRAKRRMARRRRRMWDEYQFTCSGRCTSILNVFHAAPASLSYSGWVDVGGSRLKVESYSKRIPFLPFHLFCRRPSHIAIINIMGSSSQKLG